jgi:hypothetical protein
MFLFKFPPIIYFILAPVIAAFGVMMYVDMTGDDAARAKALTHAAPPEVKIESFDAAKNVSDADEVTVIAQLDVARMSEVVRSKRGTERDRTTLGMLYPTDAKTPSGAAPGMLVIDGSIDDTALGKMVVAEGAFGPIIKVNGTIGANVGKGKETDMVVEKTAGLSPNAIYIAPFLTGRAADLAPRGGAGGLLGFSFLIAALIAGFGWFRRSRQQKAQPVAAETI